MTGPGIWDQNGVREQAAARTQVPDKSLEPRVFSGIWSEPRSQRSRLEGKGILNVGRGLRWWCPGTETTICDPGMDTGTVSLSSRAGARAHGVSMSQVGAVGLWEHRFRAPD